MRAMDTSPPPAPVTLRTFWSDLPREGRFLLSIVVIEFLGTGLVLPFSVVYLHEVRGFALNDVGLLLSLLPLTGLLVAGPAGGAIDRYGARPVLLLCLGLLVASNLMLAWATTLGAAAIALVVGGIAGGLQWPTFQSLIAAVVPRPLRQRYFGVNFTLLNLGIGLGGVLGGAVVDVERPGTFTAVYVIDALSYLPAIVLLLWPLRRVAGVVAAPHEHAAPASYATVLRSPAVPAVLTMTLVSSFVGYSQLNVGMPAFARAVGEVSTQGLGLAFAANTVVIVLIQLAVLRRVEGRRRTRVAVVMSLLWAFSWVLLGLSGLVPGTWGAALLVAACAAVFGLGETLLQPTLPALLNDLAPDHLRGRYNALNSGVFQLAAIAAPPSAGFLIGHGLPGAWIGMLLVGCALLAVIAVRSVEPAITPSVNGVHESGPGADVARAGAVE